MPDYYRPDLRIDPDNHSPATRTVSSCADLIGST